MLSTLMTQVRSRTRGGVVVAAILTAAHVALNLSATHVGTLPPASTLARQGFLLGVAVSPTGTTTTSAAVAGFENAVGQRTDLVGVYRNWAGAGSSPDASLVSAMRSWAAAGRTPLITWEPWDPTRPVTQPAYSLTAIAAGTYDPYLRTWGRALAAYGGRVHLRPMHEMNSTWYPWAGGVNGNTPAQYVAAWRHIHDVLRASGATNVSFVFSVNRTDVPSTNTFEQYWPGSGYVDVLALDGYNCYSGWKSFSDIVKAPYDRLTTLDATLPVWVTETGSCPATSAVAGATGHSRAEWITSIANASDLPRLRAVVYFDADGGFPWTLDRDAAATTALRDVVSGLPGRGPRTAVGSRTSLTPPAVPAVPVATVQPTAVRLTWPAVAGATSYRVLRDGAPLFVTLTPSATDPVDGQTHTYSIVAVRSGNASAAGESVSVTPQVTPPPAAPAGLAATALTSRVTLTWTALPTAVDYAVYRDGAQLGTTSSPVWVDAGVASGTSFGYEVAGRNAAGEGPRAGVSALTTPAVPSGLAATADPGVVRLTWTPVTGATGYRVYRDGVLAATVTSAAASDTKGTPGRSTLYAVAAFDANGQSSKSAPVAVTPR